MSERISVIGAGAWGTALALTIADTGRPVTLWMYEQDLAEETERTRENRVFLPGFALPPSVTVPSSLPEAVAERFAEITGGARLVEGYGMTEASPVTHANPVDGRARFGTLGMPMPDSRPRRWSMIAMPVDSGVRKWAVPRTRSIWWRE